MTNKTNKVPFTVTSDKDFTNLLKRFKTSQTKFSDLAHQASLQAIAHTAMKDDPQKILQFFHVLDKQVHKDQFQRWIENNTPWRLADGEKGHSFRKNKSLIHKAKKQAKELEEEYNESILYNFEALVSEPFLNIDLTSIVEEETLKKLGLLTYYQKLEQIVKDIEKVSNGEAKNKELEEADRDSVLNLQSKISDILRDKDISDKAQAQKLDKKAS